MKLTKQQLEFIRFCLVGLFNTAVDLLLFVLMHVYLDFALLIANTISTTIALGLSFILNANFTFKSQTINKKQLLSYVAITLVGLWLLQPAIIALVLYTANIIQIPYYVSSGSMLLIAKLSAVAGTTVWNYFWYSKVIFSNKNTIPVTAI